MSTLSFELIGGPIDGLTGSLEHSMHKLREIHVPGGFSEEVYCVSDQTTKEGRIRCFWKGLVNAHSGNA